MNQVINVYYCCNTAHESEQPVICPACGQVAGYIGFYEKNVENDVQKNA